ncbi:carbohydrate ABC transporter permease [Agreia pratensis]|uniref:carbohydrate ABC transporter permease n=1 Tax=Microbacteriaceae TaxID=85023 RepID=UPI00188CFF51|nr:MULTISPECIES: carbohydrate ABC transporter permease [Microbacteriaceae]MBF4561209.1 carbohydrate ABC transporter permease [Microbacterium sp. VKM Ac-2870]MBF4633903.1 carbohydrate ABC transporter permease [Agreia pratensis]
MAIATIASRSGSSRPLSVRIIKIVVLVLAVGFFVLPILYLGIMSVKSPDDILSTRILPTRLAWENWTAAFTEAPIFLYLRNSLIVAGGATLVALAIAIPANYAMSRLGTGGKRMMSVIVSAYIAPPIVAIVPLFLLIRSVGLMDSLIGMVLIEGLLVTPVAVWLLDTFFSAVPGEIDEAAQIDGCGPIATLFRIVLPLVAPGIVAVAIVAFILVYNDFLIPLMLSYGPGTQTLPVGLSLLQGGREVVFGQMAAASLTGMIPVYLLAVFMQRWLIGGLTQGSIK